MKTLPETTISNPKKVYPNSWDIEKMHDLLAGYTYSAVIYVAAKLSIADYLVEASKSCEELANLLHIPTEPLSRLMRVLSSFGIFKELEDNKYEITTLGATLRSDIKNSMRSLIIMCGSQWHWILWSGLLHTIETGKPYFVEHFGMDFFPYIKSHPEIAAEFNAAMTSLSSLSDYAIAQAYDFYSYNTLVDVGGGKGGLLVAILNHHPKIKGILYDLPEVVEAAKAIIQKEEVSNRCTIIGGNFFESIPTSSDLYIVKHVLHGLNKEQSVSILKNIKSVLKPNGKILIVEMVMPERNTASYSKINDLEMMLLSSTGRERSQHEFKEIIELSGLNLLKIIPIQMGVCLIETN